MANGSSPGDKIRRSDRAIGAIVAFGVGLALGWFLRPTAPHAVVERTAERMRRTLLVLVLQWALAASAMAQSESIETALNNRVRQYADAVSSGDPQKMKLLVTTGFGDKLQRIPMANHIANLMSSWDTTRGLTLVELQKTEAPNETVALFKNQLTGEWQGTWFKLEPEPPHRIVAIGPRPARLPPAVARKYSQRQIASELDDFLERLAEAGVFSGVVAVAKDGKVVFQGA